MDADLQQEQEKEFLQKLHWQPAHRAISCVGEIASEKIQHVTWTAAKDLYPLLYAMANNEPNAASQANLYLKGVFNTLKTILEEDVDKDHLHLLKEQYHRLLQDNNGGKYNSLAAVFPELLTRKRIFKAADLLVNEITPEHLSYMILGGIIGRAVPLFREVTSLQAGIYDPDNTITSATQRSV